MSDCVFCKIIAGEIPSVKIFENDEMLVIKEIAPQAPIHLLAMPKRHFTDISAMDEEDAALVGRMLYVIGKHADEWGLGEGYRVVSNKGENGCQSVPHLHIHILGGEKLPNKLA